MLLHALMSLYYKVDLYCFHAAMVFKCLLAAEPFKSKFHAKAIYANQRKVELHLFPAQRPGKVLEIEAAGLNFNAKHMKNTRVS